MTHEGIELPFLRNPPIDPKFMSDDGFQAWVHYLSREASSYRATAKALHAIATANGTVGDLATPLPLRGPGKLATYLRSRLGSDLDFSNVNAAGIERIANEFDALAVEADGAMSEAVASREKR